MAAQEVFLRQELVRPARRDKQVRGVRRRKVTGPLKALVGPQNRSRVLDRAVSPRRRHEIVQASGYDAQAQKLTFQPYLRALVVRQIRGGTLHDLQHGMAEDPLYEVHGARLEISVPGLSKANAQRPTQPFWEILAEVRAAVEVLPRRVRIGRVQPLQAATPQGSVSEMFVGFGSPEFTLITG
jgi:hypothetical protein